jgi:hypothetical protein
VSSTVFEEEWILNRRGRGGRGGKQENEERGVGVKRLDDCFYHPATNSYSVDDVPIDGLNSIIFGSCIFLRVLCVLRGESFL